MDWTALAISVRDTAGSAASFGKDAATGAGEGLASLANGPWSLGRGAVNAATQAATDPAYRQAVLDNAESLARSAANYGGRLIDDPVTRGQEAYERAQALAGSLKKEFVDARDLAERSGTLAEFYGNVAGRGGFEVAACAVPVTKLGALSKAGRVGEAAEIGKAAEVAQSLRAVKAGAAVQECRLASEAAVFVKAESAETVNAAMREAGELGAYKEGSNVITEVIPKGTRFQMVVSDGQGKALMKGSPKFGRFATSEVVPSQAYAREKLVILEEFKSDVTQVVTVETTVDQVIRRGITGPLQNYGGGAQQVEFLEKNLLRMVGDAVDLPVK